MTGANGDTVILAASSTTSGGLASASTLCTAGLTIAVCTGDGNDTVEIRGNPTVNGVIDGGAGSDTLRFTAVPHSLLAELTPASGTITISGKVYQWVNFERLVGIPSISISDVTQSESNGTTTFTFNVTLSVAIPEVVTVDVSTANGTALAGTDYTALPTTTVTFPANTTGPQLVSITVLGNTKLEPDKTFFVNLVNASANATILDGQGLGTIVNDDVAVTALSIAKSAPPAVLIGVPFDYTITVTNAGPDASSGATVTDVLPESLALVSVTPSQGSCSGTTTVVCTLGPLAGGATATITLTVRATSSGSIANTATVSTAESDPVVVDNSSSTTSAASAPAIPILSPPMLLVLALAMGIGAASIMRRGHST
jgi:uncharacterized repeat protein (TIGR01451 family)